MHKQALQGFSGGLTQDKSKSSDYSKNYYYGKNIRLISNEGLATGAIESIKGTRLEFEIPSLQAINYTLNNGTQESVLDDNYSVYIFGGVTINDDIIIVSGSLSLTPTNQSTTSVWKCKYDKQTDTILDLLPNGQLDPTKHLIYRRDLGMTNYSPLKIIAKYETSQIQRIYWTDGIGQIRVVNTNLPFYIDPNTFQVVNEMQRVAGELTYLAPNIKFSLPQLEEVTSGYLPKGSIQYAYRLVNSEGGRTRFSPQTPLIDLVDGEVSGTYGEYPLVQDDVFRGKLTEGEKKEKEAAKNESNKSVKIKITDLDTRYDYIQLCYILYRDKDQAEIFMLPEEKIDLSTGIYEYTHTGNEQTEVKITRDEFIALSNPFENVQTIETKDNILLVANTVTPIFDVPLDTRAYRFNKNRVCKLYERKDYQDPNGPRIISGTSLPNPPAQGLNTWGIPETDNVINPFNDEGYLDPSNIITWQNDFQYKYQSDGKTFGGEGPNVKYSFTLNSNKAAGPGPDALIADNTVTAPMGKPFISSPKHNLKDFAQLSGLGNAAGYQFNLGGSFQDLKSPYKANLYTGYARGEVYRFGIVFFDKKGNESFVKWIGDIKFPEFTDLQNGNPEFDLSSFDGTNLYLYSLGIEFEITIPPQIADTIEAFKIVRMERREEWRTRLGTGATGAFAPLDNSTVWLNFYNNVDSITKHMFESHASKILGNKLQDAVEAFKEALANFLKLPIVPSAPLGSPPTILPGQPGSSPNTVRSLTPDALEKLLSSALQSVDTFGIKLIPDYLCEKLAKLIVIPLTEILDVFVAGIAAKVGYLGANYSFDANLVSSFQIPFPTGISGKNIGYVINPIISFDRYHFRFNDYIQPFKAFTIPGYDKLIKPYHEDATTGYLTRTKSIATYRKWFRGTLLDPTQDSLNQNYKRTIQYQNKMDVGEIVRSANSTTLNGVTYINGHIGYIERFKYPHDPSDNGILYRGIKTLGIGDRKHFLVLKDNMPTIENTSNLPTFEADLKEQDYGQLITRIVDVTGDFLVSYNRYVKNAYNGNTYSERSNAKYIDCGHFLKIDQPGLYTCKVYGGDVSVALFDAVNYAYYFDKSPGYQPSKRVKKGIADIFPCEVPFNVNLREGHHFAVSQDTDSLDEESRRSKRQRRKEAKEYKKSGVNPATIAELVGKKRFVFDEFILDDVYEQENSIRQYFPKPLLNTFDQQNAERIWKSKVKINAEIFDSWRMFYFLEFIDVDGNQGPIKNLINVNNKLFFYQTRGIGVAATNERELTAGVNGNPTTLGTIKYLSRYDYLTKGTGIQNRFGAIRTPNGVYHLDTILKRIIKISDSEGLADITFLEGMSSYLNLNLNYYSSEDFSQAAIVTGYNPTFSTVYFQVSTTPEKTGFMITYNEKLQIFESFIDGNPDVMFNSNDDLFSYSGNDARIWSHNKGEYGKIYNTYYNSEVKLLLNSEPYKTKEFNNLIFKSEVIDITGAQLNETVNTLEVSNDIQSSLPVTLIPNNNIKRKFRSWTTTVPRDQNTAGYTSFKSRMRDKHMFLDLKYLNNNNKRFILHDVQYVYQDGELSNKQQQQQQ